MKIADLINVLEGEVICCEDKLDHEVSAFAASDLLSDILAFEKENYALLTGLTNSQIVRTAEITNACCVVILRGKQPQQAAVLLARRSGIPLILSRSTMFDACCCLSRFLEKHPSGIEGAPNPAGT
jgi:predicted transcriptional regulator